MLFGGSLGQRKGLSYLLKSVGILDAKVELTLLGRKTSDGSGPLNEAVKRHRWILSLPQPEVLREMGCHDFLVFSSLFKGFGLVILEAMAQELPVITTTHTAGMDIITDGVDGLIVPIRSPDAIAGKLKLFAGDRLLLQAMRDAAISTTRRLTWGNYRRALVKAMTTGMANAKR